MEVVGEFIIDKSPVDLIMATGRAIGGKGGGGNIVLYCEYCVFGLPVRNSP